MDFDRLREFVLIADHGSLRSAAAALRISVATLSARLIRFEEHLGVSLFDRGDDKMTLTAAGEQLLPSALEILSSYPDIELKYDILPGSTPVSVMSQYDLFFTTCVYHDAPQNSTKFFSRSHGTFCLLPPGHPLMSKPAVYLHQLTGQTVIVPHAEELFGPYAQNWMLTEKATRGQVSIIKVDNLSTALFLVTMGKGICIAPIYAKNMLPAETFIVSISDPNCRFDEYLYYTETGNGAAKMFFEEFKTTANQ